VETFGRQFVLNPHPHVSHYIALVCTSLATVFVSPPISGISPAGVVHRSLTFLMVVYPKQSFLSPLRSFFPFSIHLIFLERTPFFQNQGFVRSVPPLSFSPMLTPQSLPETFFCLSAPGVGPLERITVPPTRSLLPLFGLSPPRFIFYLVWSSF